MPPAYEVLLLNTAIPQIQAAQSGDTYVVPRDIAINATAIISANSATDALRITQTGAGNALLVEDSANPDSSPFVVTAAGDVGVGTSSPAGKLDVSGGSSDTAAYIRTTSSTTGVNARLHFTTGVCDYIIQNQNNGGALDSILRFVNGTTGSQIAAFDYSGNLGLGVTPSALWDSAFRAIQVGLLTSLAYNNSFGQTHLLNNAIYTTSWVYQTSGVAAVRYDQRNGEHQWFRSTSAQVAGTDPVFSQAMTLDASGNLGVGITSPAARLDVNATSGTLFRCENPGKAQLNIGNGNTSTNYYDADLQIFRSGGGTEVARITSGGNLGVGTTSPIAFSNQTSVTVNGTNTGRFDLEVNETHTGALIATSSVVDLTAITNIPITFGTNSTERARITSGGDFQTSSGNSVMVGGTAARATTAGTNRVDIFDGTAPVGTLANGISLYSSSGEAYVMDAAGNATLFSPHDAETNEWIFKSKHTPTGKVLKIDVEKLLRFINDHFGLDAVHEFIEE